MSARKNALEDWVEDTQIVARSSEATREDAPRGRDRTGDDVAIATPDSSPESQRQKKSEGDADAHEPTAGSSQSDSNSRVFGIWREWLQTLASDSEAAIAAALTYRQFSPEVRDEWIAALETDMEGLPVSRVAVFAPLLAAETDPGRRLRIAHLLQPALVESTEIGKESYYRGRRSDGAVVAMIVSPLYLDFVQLLACAYFPGDRFIWVRHDPIAHKDRCQAARETLSDVQLESTPRHVVVDELAQTVVAVHRRGEGLPEPLCSFAHLFNLGD